MTILVDLLDSLRARGVELVPAGDRLRFRPADAVTTEEREALRLHKHEVLALLAPVRTARTAYAHPWPDAVPGLGPRTIGPFDPCACGTWSWVRYGGTVACLRCAIRLSSAPAQAVMPQKGPA